MKMIKFGKELGWVNPISIIRVCEELDVKSFENHKQKRKNYLEAMQRLINSNGRGDPNRDLVTVDNTEEQFQEPPKEEEYTLVFLYFSDGSKTKTTMPLKEVLHTIEWGLNN